MKSDRSLTAATSVAMHRVLLSALFAAGALAATVRADDPEFDYVTGLTLDAGLSGAGTVTVDEMVSLRFTSALEVEFAVRRGGRIDLLYRPSRFGFSQPLGTSAQVMVPVPHTGGRDGLLVVQGDALVLKIYDDSSGVAIYAERTLVTPQWGGVTRLWAFPRLDGTTDVYGYAPGRSLLRRGILDGEIWTNLESTPLGTEIRDLAYVEWDGQPGPEMAGLLTNSLKVLSLDWSITYLSLPAQPADSMARLQDEDSPTDRLVWAMTIGSNSYVTAIDPVHGLASPYLLPAAPAAALPLNEYSPLETWVFALPWSGTLGASLLRVEKDEGSFTIEPVGLGEAIDVTDPTADTDALAVAAVGDYDLDGDDDLLCAGEGGSVYYWRNIPFMEDALDAWMVRSEEDAPPSLNIGGAVGGGAEIWHLTLPMQRGTQAPESYHVRVSVGDGVDPLELLVFDELVTPVAGPGEQDLLFELVFEFDQPLELDTRLRISLTGVDLGAGDEVLHRHPTRTLAWEPMTGLGPEDALQPVPQHVEGLECYFEKPIGGGIDATGVHKGARPKLPPAPYP